MRQLISTRHFLVNAGIFFLLAGMAGCSGGGANVSSDPAQIGAGATSGTASGMPAATTTGTAPSVTSAADPSATDSRLTSAIATSAASASSIAGIAIDAGSSSSVGNWIADNGSGGYRAVVSNAINSAGVPNPAPQAVYQSQRTGSSVTYVVQNLAANRAYNVRLHFVESWFTGAGNRRFNVKIGNTQVLSDFDIFQAAGGRNIAVAKQFVASADGSGKITIALAATVNLASIAGIEVTSSSATASSTPVPVGSAPAPAPAPPPPAPAAQGSYSSVFPQFAGNRRLSSNPAIHPQSQRMMDTLRADSSSLTGPGLNDNVSTFYSAKSSDPLHSIHCTEPWGPGANHSCVMEGKQIHIPSGAVPSANSDRHTSILAPDGCTVDDFWLAQDLSSRTVTVAMGAEFNQCSESGFNTHGGAAATAGGASLRVGRSPLSEMQTGVIHHALTAVPGCDLTSAFVGQATFPGQYQACKPGVSGVGIPMGAYLWSDVTNLPAGLDNATRMVCTALNQYGAVVDDTNGNWNGLSLNAFWSNVNTPGYASWFAANAGPGGSVSPSKCFPNGDWSHHIHVLAW
jgi:Malectin domain